MVQVHLGPPLNGVIAQLGERLFCTQEVSGSIPLSSTIYYFHNKEIFEN